MQLVLKLENAKRMEMCWGFSAHSQLCGDFIEPLLHVKKIALTEEAANERFLLKINI